MKTKFDFIHAVTLVTFLSVSAFAIQDPAPDPSNGSGWSTQAGEIDNIQSQNAAVGPGNPNGTYYWFMASDSQSNASYPNGAVFQVAPGKTQPSGAPGISGGGGNTEILSGNTINNTLANHTYHVYAQACPNSVLANQPGCSNWILINPNAVVTKPLPTAPIVGPATADVTTNAETLHTTGSSVPDPSNVQFWNIGLDNVQSGSVQVFAPSQRSYSSASQLVKVGPGGSYNFTLLPNNRYRSTSQVVYFWSQPTAVPGQVANFTTTPVQPGPATVPALNITHCSAQVNVQNSVGLPANPTYTDYKVCLNNGAGCSTPKAINGSAQSSDIVTFNFTSLTAGVNYSGTSQALNEDNAWNDSQTNTVPNFMTVAWGGTFSVTPASIGTTSADFVAAGVNTAGVQSWAIQTTPPVAGLPTGDASDLNGTHTMTGLSINTHYTVQILITEASGCSSLLPLTPIAFTTDAGIPTAFALSIVNPTQLNASWGNGGNGAGTSYQLKYCVNDPTVSCGTTKVVVGLNTSLPGLTPETSYYANVTASSVGGGSNSAPSNTDVKFTPNEVPTVSPVNVTVHVTSATLSATASDNGGPTHLVYHWAVTSSPGGSAFNFTANDTSGASASTQLTFDTLGTYSGTLTVTDHDNVDSSKLSTTVLWTTNGAAQTPTTIDPIVPNPGTVVVGAPGVSFNAVIRDQFGVPMTSGLSGVTWTLSNGAASLTPPVVNSTFTIVSGVDSTINGGNVTLTVQLANGASRSVSITVRPSGIQFNGPNNPSVTLIPNANGVTTANLHCLATANSPGAGTPNYSWSLESGPNAVGTIASTGDAVVTFSAAGTYSFRCSVTDQLPNESNFAVTNSTTVLQTLGGLTVSPNHVTLQTLQNQVFTASAVDQFNQSMPTPSNLQWSAMGGGNVAGAGAQASFSASIIGQAITINATEPLTGRIGAATVNIISFDVSNASAFPVPYKASFNNGGVIHFKNLGTQWGLRIYTGSGRRVFDYTGNTDTFDWNIKNSSGESIASGVYFYKIESPSGKKDGKLIIIQ